MRVWGRERIPIVAIVLVLAILVVVMATGTDWAVATEPAKRFLDGLRARGMHDAALLYLDQAKTSPLVPDDFKATLPYERGVTLLALAKRAEDPQLRSRRISEAETVLESVAKDQASDPRAIEAQVELADALLRRGRELVNQAERPNEKTRREALLAEARGLFEQVRKKSE